MLKFFYTYYFVSVNVMPKDIKKLLDFHYKSYHAEQAEGLKFVFSWKETLIST